MNGENDQTKRGRYNFENEQQKGGHQQNLLDVVMSAGGFWSQGREETTGHKK